jgi:hypothetical protein
MAWRDLATALDQVVVHTFDEGGCSLQPMSGPPPSGTPVGGPIAVPAEFDPAFQDQAIEDGQTLSIQRIVADIHYDDLPTGTVIAVGWQFIVATPSPNAGTYYVDSLEPNNDKTGVRLRLKKS